MRAMIWTSTLLLATSAAQAGDFGRMFDKVVPSVVCIVSKDKNDNLSTGTGVVTTAGIITANHVLTSDVVVAMFPERDPNGAIISKLAHYSTLQRMKECRVIARSPSKDLALIQPVEPLRVPAVTFAIRSASPGEEAFAIGAAAGDDMFHFISGNIRAVHDGTYTAKDDSEVQGKILQTSLPLNHGDSGSPLFDAAGHLVGLNLATDSAKNTIQYAIHTSEIRAFIAQVKMERLKSKEGK